MAGLNTAGSACLTTWHGIGPSFAGHIINYGNRLGGFYRKEQLKEVLGLDSSTSSGLQAEVRVDACYCKKVPLNSVTFETWSHFPYLTYKQVDPIIQFRDQPGWVCIGR